MDFTYNTTTGLKFSSKHMQEQIYKYGNREWKTEEEIINYLKDNYVEEHKSYWAHISRNSYRMESVESW